MAKKSKKKNQNKNISSDKDHHPNANVTSFAIGDPVTLHGLRATQYNGKSGRITSLLTKHTQEIRYGVLLDGKDEPISIKCQNLALKHKDCFSSNKNSCDSYAKRSGDLNLLSLLVNITSMHENIVKMMYMNEDIEVKLFGRKINQMPNFFEEMQRVGFPFGVNVESAKSFLRLSYENYRDHPRTGEYMMLLNPHYEPSKYDLIKRLCNLDNLTWYTRQDMNSIFPNVTKEYPAVRHNFSNQAYRKEILTCGTTHVAIGFVDLGLLFAATLKPNSDPFLSDKPLTFIGIEKSAYAVAKTLVLWDLIQRACTGCRRCILAIIQVWFSSTWEKFTFEAVQAVLSNLCSEHKITAYHPDVKKILLHWRGASMVSVHEARLHIISNLSTESVIGCMTRKIDRMAVAAYELTKDFGLEGNPYCGSLVMFRFPDDIPLENQTVFSAFNFKDVMDLLLDSKPEATIMNVMLDYTVLNIMKIVQWAKRDMVKVQLHSADVRDSVQFIAERKPWSMSWSNLVDYFNYEEFHDMVRACSINGHTIHYGYSMNWNSHVYGVNIIDFSGPNHTDFRSRLIKDSSKLEANVYKSEEWNRYLRFPLPINPINTTSFMLQLDRYKYWCEYFFKFAKSKGPCNIAYTDMNPFHFPLSPTGGSTVYFAWTYDPNVCLKGVFLDSACELKMRNFMDNI